MKNRKVLGTRKNGTPYLRNNNSILKYVSGEALSIARQISAQNFDVVSDLEIAIWIHFYSKAENNMPTFDIDGATTTIFEMLQHKSVSDLGNKFPVYINDRQVRNLCLTEELVASRKFEKARVIAWVPSSDFILDITNVHEYTLSIPVNPEYETYSDLSELLDN